MTAVVSGNTQILRTGDEILAKIKKRSHRVIVCVVTAIFLSVLMISCLLFHSGYPDDTSGAVVSTQSFNTPSVTVNDIPATEKSTRSSSPASAQRIILCPVTEKSQRCYSLNSAVPDANDSKVTASSVVPPPKGSAVKVTAIKAPSAISVTAGDSAGINVQLIPENAADKNVRWSSDHPEIASVDKTGMVTGKHAGSCQITVSSLRGNVKASITVTVK